MAAVGVEEFGADDFVQGKYFDGDVFIDTKKQIYKDLGYKRLSFMAILGVLFSSRSRATMAEAKKANISGNLKGDGYQSGGILIVKPDGEVLLNYTQGHPSEILPNSEILKALGLETSGSPGGEKPTAVCDDEACSLPPK